MLLVISDDGQHHWIPGRHVKVRKEEEMVTRASILTRRAPAVRTNRLTTNNYSDRLQGQAKANPPRGQLKKLTTEREKLAKEQLTFDLVPCSWLYSYLW